VRLVERGVLGTFNAVGPAAPTNLAHIISVAVKTLSPTSKVTWVPTQWLLAQGHGERWGTLLFFSHGISEIMRMSNRRALEQGLTTRPIDVTLRDIVSWHRGQPPEQTSSLITGFQRQRDGTWTAATSTWSAYLAQEKEVLAAWHHKALRPSPRLRDSTDR
jgi:2'-hydroxyisoflavone reductase